MKKYYFHAVLFLFVSACTVSNANAQQSPEVKYYKAKKKNRDAQAAQAAQEPVREQSVEAAPVQQQDAQSPAKKAESMKSKAVKRNEVKASAAQKAASKEQTKTN